MRQRSEDLGRIAELLKEITQREIFDIFSHLRCKDVAEWFLSLSDEEKFEKINTIAYSLQDMEHDLCEVWHIARYGDDLEEG